MSTLQHSSFPSPKYGDIRAHIQHLAGPDKLDTHRGTIPCFPYLRVVHRARKSESIGDSFVADYLGPL